mgnify:CR=1 FL=1
MALYTTIDTATAGFSLKIVDYYVYKLLKIIALVVKHRCTVVWAVSLIAYVTG